MAKCKIIDCAVETFGDKSECVLHLEKSSYHSDSNRGILKSFFSELIKEISEFPFQYKDQTNTINSDAFSKYLSTGEFFANDIVEFAKESLIVLQNIKFPERDDRDSYDYLRALQKLGCIHFIDCDFHTHSLSLSNVKCFYQNCQFHANWYIYNSLLLENVNSVLYQECVFHQYVSTTSDDSSNVDENYILENTLFNNCSFKQKLEFHRIESKKPLFNNTDSVNTLIEHFQLSECIFHEKFILNNCNINIYHSSATIFNSKFEFKNNKVNSFYVDDTNHFGLVDTFGTHFDRFNISKSIFKDFVGFEECQFGSIDNQSIQNISTFKYATFLSFVNFRNTTFNSGLDIKNINLKEAPNFLNVNIHSNNSNRETFRIIKNSFDKIGNNIEANKFFVFEMKKYKEELKNSDQYQERFILFLNENISNFGQSYIKPILWIIALSVVYTLIVVGYENNSLYKIIPSANNAISGLADSVNQVAKSILPFKNVLANKIEFISLIFYIVFTSLIWQTVIALKKHTKK